MAELFWENVEVGTEVPLYPRTVTLMELNRFAAANDEFGLIHMDRDYAQNVTLFPDVVLMGNLKYAYLSNMIQNWIGESGTLKKLSVSYRRYDIPSPALSTEPTIICKGKVTKKYTQNGDHYAECDVWVEDKEGEITTPGKAVVILPTRGG